MTAPAVVKPLKYSAFLSYAHADGAWARWLHRRLEDYRVNKDLAGRDTPSGPVPQSLGKVFRDRDDFTAGHTLTDATLAALDSSAALIVLCSAMAATRTAVNEEVRLFRFRHPNRRVIPVVIDGVFPDNFPAALRFEIAPAGTVTERPVTILGPDLRDSGDGKRLGLAKIVGGLLGVDTDEIMRRAERAARTRSRIWLASVSAIALSLAALAGWAEYNRREAVDQRRISELRRQQAERNFALAKETADGLVFDIALGLRDVTGMSNTALVNILGTAQRTFEQLAAGAPKDPELRRSRSVMLLAFGDTYRAQGALSASLSSYRHALFIREELATEDPSDAGWQDDLSVAHEKLGDALRDSGDLTNALEHFNRSMVIREALSMAKDSSNVARRRHDLTVSLERIGDILQRRGDLPAALDRYSMALAIILELATAEPKNADWQRALWVAYGKVGDVLIAQGNVDGGMSNWKSAKAVATQLGEADSDSAVAQRALAVVELKIGGLLRDQRQLEEALVEYRASLAIRDRLAAADKGNATWRFDVGIAHERIGEVLLIQRDFSGALEHFHTRHEITERLVAADQMNANWRRDLGVSYNKMADALTAQGDAKGALLNRRRAHEISLQLSKADPAHPGWKTDLSVSSAKLRDALAARGDMTAQPVLQR